jgi:hypothetical protein
MMKFFTVLVGFSLVLASCGSSPAQSQRSARELAIEQATPIRTEPAQRPVWMDEVPKSSGTLSFVGLSPRYVLAAQARDEAQQNGRRQLVDYYGTLMVNQGREYTATYGISNEVFSPQVAAQQLNERIAQNVSQALEARSFYTQVYLDATNREAFEVGVLMEIDKTRVAKVIDDYGKEEAADLLKKAAAEQDTQRRQQMEKSAEFFGGNLSSKLGF